MKKSIHDCLKNTFNGSLLIHFIYDMAFDSSAGESTIKKSSYIYVISAIIQSVCIGLLLILNTSMSLIIIPIILVLFLTIGFVSILIWSSIVNIFLRYFGAKNTNYKKTASVFLFSNIARVAIYFGILYGVFRGHEVFNFYIPLATMITLYQFIGLDTLGLSKKYKMTYTKTFLSILLPIIILGILFLVLTNLNPFYLFSIVEYSVLYIISIS